MSFVGMIALVAKVFAGLFAFLLIYQVIIRVLAKTLRRYIAVPAPAFLGVLLDSRFRKKIQPPRDIVLRSGVKQGLRVVDLGCGSGTFTLEMARQGRYYRVFRLTQHSADAPPLAFRGTAELIIGILRQIAEETCKNRTSSTR